MSMTLSQVVDEYLTSNGIKKEFFASYIGCGSSKCALWFKGERKLTEEQLQNISSLKDLAYQWRKSTKL